MSGKLEKTKGIIVIGIIFVHTIIFTDNYNSLPEILRLVYSLLSVTIPTYLMICGYQYYFKENKALVLKQNIKEYLIYGVLTLLISLIIFKINYTVYDLMLFNQMSVGYMWLIKIGLYCQIAFYLVKKDKEYIITIILVLLASTVNTDLREMIFYISSFSLGYLLASSNNKINRFIPSYAVVIIGLIPLVFQLNYYQSDIRLLLFSFVLVSGLLNININKEIKFLNFYAKNFINFIFVHYLVIELMLKLNISFRMQVTYIIVTLIVSSLIVLALNQVQKVIGEELSKK